MITLSKRVTWPYFLLFGVVVVVAAGAFHIFKTGTAKYKVGLVTWIGYAPLYVAQDKGYFKDENLSVELTIMDAAGARGPAYISRDIDFYPDTPDSFVILFSSERPTGKFVMAMDDSEGGDGIVSKKSISSIADLRGKTIGYQTGITSHFLLLYLLNHNGLKASDIKSQNLSAADAGPAFLSGHLDAAVTWEPWLTNASKQADSHVLATSADTPGLITDVLLASDRVMQDDPAAIGKFKRAFFRGVQYIQDHPSEALPIVEKALNLKHDDAVDQLQKVKFYKNEEESSAYLKHKLPSVITECSQLYLANHVIKQRPPALEYIIDVGH